MALKNDWRELVRNEMKVRGVTQVELARRIGIKQATVSLYLSENGPCPGLDVVERFNEALGIETQFAAPAA